MTIASAVSTPGTPLVISRLNPRAWNMPHLVGMRAFATRQSIEVSGVAFMYALAFQIYAATPSYPATQSTCRWGMASLGRRRALLRFRNGAARAQAVDFSDAEPELLENLVVVFSKRRSALRSNFRHAVHLNGAADRRGQFAACAFKRNDDLIRSQLRIVDNFLWPADDAEGDVNAIEGVIPMRHRLRAEDFVENRGQLGHVLRQLGRIGESRIREEIGTADCFRNRGELVWRNDKKEPGAVRSAIHIQRRIRRILSVVRSEELRFAQRRLDRNACRPDALGEERRRDIGSLAGSLATIERRNNRGIEADGGGLVAASRHWPGRRLASVAGHGQQAASRPIGRDVESWQIGVGAVFAEAGEIRIDQTRIPLHDITIFELQSLARGMRGVDDEHVGPLDE